MGQLSNKAHQPLLRGQRGVLLIRNGEEEEALLSDLGEGRGGLLLAYFVVVREDRVHERVVVDGDSLRELLPRAQLSRNLLC